MPQINLLTNPSQQASLREEVLIYWVIRLLSLVLIAGFVWYGYAWYRVHSTANDIAQLQEHINQQQQSMVVNPDRAELLARQAQLKSLTGLVGAHLYWSNFFPELAAVTLKSVYYTSLTAQADGTVAITVSVPDYTELDRFLQIFDLPEVNKNFTNLKIVSIAKTETEQGVQLNVKISLSYNTVALKKAAASSLNQ